MNSYDRIEHLCDQWERNCGSLPPDARHLLRKVAKQIVLDAAAECDKRANIQPYPVGIRNEASKCGAQIRHNLLCREGESICLRCDGRGCTACEYRGLKGTTP